MKQHETRQYDIRNAAAFKKTTEQWGGLSNMAAGYPVVVNDVVIKTVESLYQACRFPHLPEVQEKIISQESPMTAKMVGKPFKNQSRDDWLAVRILIMKWCLRVKLAQNWDKFSSLLISTSDMDIIEISNRDDFWGAKPTEPNICVGINALGRLLMELRGQVLHNSKERFMVVPPLAIKHFKLYNQDIVAVDSLHAKKITTPQINMFEI